MIDSSFEVILCYKAHPGKDSRLQFLFLPFCQPPLLRRRLVPSCARPAARRDADNPKCLERLGTERSNGMFETAGTVGTGLKITLNCREALEQSAAVERLERLERALRFCVRASFSLRKNAL